MARPLQIHIPAYLTLKELDDACEEYHVELFNDGDINDLLATSGRADDPAWQLLHACALVHTDKALRLASTLPPRSTGRLCFRSYDPHKTYWNMERAGHRAFCCGDLIGLLANHVSRIDLTNYRFSNFGKVYTHQLPADTRPVKALALLGQCLDTLLSRVPEKDRNTVMVKTKGERASIQDLDEMFPHAWGGFATMLAYYSDIQPEDDGPESWDTGYDIHVRDSHGNTILHELAAHGRNPETIIHFINQGCHTQVVNHAGKTPDELLAINTHFSPEAVSSLIPLLQAKKLTLAAEPACMEIEAEIDLI